MEFQILRTAPTVYLDQTGAAINGFKVTLYIPSVDETHFLNVPTLDSTAVKKAAEALVKQRIALNDLGQTGK
jgi:hypothetical protein